MSEAPAGHLRLGKIVGAVLLGLLLVLLVGRSTAGFYLEHLWFESLGYSSVFWTRTLWRWGAKAVVAVGTAGLVLLNLRLVASTFGAIRIRRRFGDLEFSERIPKAYVTWAAWGTAALLGLWFTTAVTENFVSRLLLLAHSGPWGSTDPVLGHDLGFYTFHLPVYRDVLAFGLVLVFLLLALASAGYAATGEVQWTSGRLKLARTARLHLGVIAAFFLLLLGARFWLGRPLLLLDGNSQVAGIFGYADANARLPAYGLLAGVAALAAGGVLWGAWKEKLAPVVGALGLLLVALLGTAQAYPSVVQRFQVEPNELARETPYIEWSLDFTRIGFGLDRLERRPFAIERGDSLDFDEALRQVSGLPMWTRDALLRTFQAHEARFNYYNFSDVTIDRYAVEGGRVPAALSAREIDPAGIEDPNWQNLHLRERYLRGMGLVATSATAATAEGRPEMWIAEIPPERQPGAPPSLQLERPSLFVGGRPQEYAIVTPGDSVFTAPDGSPARPGVDYPDGIALDSFLRKLTVAWVARDANILFASEITDSSRLVLRRQVAARVPAIAPFLGYVETPYPVLSDGRVVWVFDAFTTSTSFPLAAARSLGGISDLRFVRNHVKVVVDAVTGEVAYYRIGSDPITDAYSRAFPELFRPGSEMPEGVREHLRYPRRLLELQAEILQVYHQETAARFHGSQDVWTIAQELAEGNQPVAYRAEYGLYRLPGDPEPRFHLATVFVPQGRQNLAGILAADSDPDTYGSLALFEVPVGRQVPGPRQVEALIEQDPAISQQFSLWRQGGSQVWLGHLHLVPVGERSLLYVEAVFLAAEADAIPELRRFVASDGERVVMEPTLEGALARLVSTRTGGRPPTEELEGEAPAGGAGPEGGVTPPIARWPQEAIDLLDEAEARLREGDWAGFGEALRRLREVLERAGGGGAPALLEPPTLP